MTFVIPCCRLYFSSNWLYQYKRLPHDTYSVILTKSTCTLLHCFRLEVVELELISLQNKYTQGCYNWMRWTFTVSGGDTIVSFVIFRIVQGCPNQKKIFLCTLELVNRSNELLSFIQKESYIEHYSPSMYNNNILIIVKRCLKWGVGRVSDRVFGSPVV